MFKENSDNLSAELITEEETGRYYATVKIVTLRNLDKATAQEVPYGLVIVLDMRMPEKLKWQLKSGFFARSKQLFFSSIKDRQIEKLAGEPIFEYSYLSVQTLNLRYFFMDNIKDFIPAYYDNEPYDLEIFPNKENFDSEEKYRSAVSLVRTAIEKDQKSFNIRILNHLNNKKFQCESCNKMFIPNWNGFHWPLRPITMANGNIAVPVSAETHCTICHKATKFSYPQAKTPTNQVLLFHDEAYRTDNKHLIFSGVMCHKYFFDEMNSRLSSFKKLIGVDGRLHMCDIWNVKINENPEFLIIVEDFCNFLKDSEHINLFCTLKKTLTKPPKGKVAKKNFRRERFLETATMLLTHEISLITDADAQPILIFDRDNENQKWLSEAFAAFSCTLMFTFSTHLIKIPAIKTVPGGSNAGSEVADFVCYLIARYIDGKADVDPSWLGDIMYIVKDKQGGTRSIKRASFPHDLYVIT